MDLASLQTMHLPGSRIMLCLVYLSSLVRLMASSKESVRSPYPLGK